MVKYGERDEKVGAQAKLQNEELAEASNGEGKRKRGVMVEKSNLGWKENGEVAIIGVNPVGNMNG